MDVMYVYLVYIVSWYIYIIMFSVRQDDIGMLGFCIMETGLKEI